MDLLASVWTTPRMFLTPLDELVMAAEVLVPMLIVFGALIAIALRRK